jgi:hypothetical protein
VKRQRINRFAGKDQAEHVENAVTGDVGVGQNRVLLLGGLP